MIFLEADVSVVRNRKGGRKLQGLSEDVVIAHWKHTVRFRQVANKKAHRSEFWIARRSSSPCSRGSESSNTHRNCIYYTSAEMVLMQRSQAADWNQYDSLSLLILHATKGWSVLKVVYQYWKFQQGDWFACLVSHFCCKGWGESHSLRHRTFAVSSKSEKSEAWCCPDELLEDRPCCCRHLSGYLLSRNPIDKS